MPAERVGATAGRNLLLPKLPGCAGDERPPPPPPAGGGGRDARATPQAAQQRPRRRRSAAALGAIIIKINKKSACALQLPAGEAQVGAPACLRC